MKGLRHPASPLYRSETNLDENLVSEEDSEEEGYHRMTGANRQLHGQSSQILQSLNSTIGSNADQKTSTLTETPSDPGFPIAQAIDKLANKNFEQSFFHPKNILTFNGTKK